MTDTFMVRRGSKLADDAGLTDSEALVMSPVPDDTAVEAQDGSYSGWVQCPYCGRVGWAVGLGLQGKQTIMCGPCGKQFTVP